MPEIALTPAVAGQFFQRFGDRVAILHSRLPRRRTRRAMAADSRRHRQRGGRHALGCFRAGAEPGAGGDRRRARCELQAAGDAALQRPGCRHRPRAGSQRVVVLGSATPSLESRYNSERGKYTLIELPERIERAAHAGRRSDRHARRSFWRHASRRRFRAGWWRPSMNG